MQNLLIILLWGFTTVAFAQTTLTYPQIDSLTYQQFLRKDYGILQQTGKKAISNGIDFYYLRMRLGISYYTQTNYEKALPHFAVAYHMNPADTLNQEYYYFTLLYTLRTTEAAALSQQMPTSLYKRLDCQRHEVKHISSSFESVSLSSGIILTDNLDKKTTNFRQEGLYAENTLQGGSLLGGISLHNRINSKLSVYNSLNYFSVNTIGVLQSLFWGTSQRAYTNHNYNYVGGIHYEIPKYVVLSGFFSYYNENSVIFTSPTPQQRFNPVFLDNIYQKGAFIYGLAVSKRYRQFGLTTAFSIGNLSNVRQYQNTTSLLYYPFGNTKFYTLSGVVYLNNNQKNQWIFMQNIGGSITKKLGYDMNISYGNHQNYTSSDGLTTYNTIAPILWVGGGSLIISYKNWVIIPTYNYQQREQSYTKIVAPNPPKILTYTYHNHLLKCTLQWKF